ncbi:MAG TPA: protein translocase subunit SecD [Candidatus Dormibacteraeota bacterium]|jgi:preprotein translocase subunit SecD|nr:protein translocase subunit SecD [Candidatus Dormibacteraeota bacterium]
MRVDRRLLLLIVVIALLALFVDGFAYIYRVATRQPLTGPIHGVPTLSIPALGLNAPIYVHKGLDLQGGTHLELEITNVRSGMTPQEAQAVAVNIIERRVNSSGFAESVVRAEGNNRIIVELPGVNLEQAKQILGKTSYLTIWEWVPGTPDAATLQQLDPTAATSFQGYKPQFTHIDGSMISSASRSTDSQTNLPDVNISFNATGSDLFCKLTTDRFSHTAGSPDNKIAIFIDKNLVTDADVNGAICGGSGIITGGFTAASAEQLAVQLNSGALPGTISIASASEVGATLGATTVTLSLAAGAFGLAIVVLFMLLYYRLPGLVASLALMLYAAIALAIFKLFGVTLTLAGLAGFILSVGMAVDANVLIFERVKEELRAGRTLGAAMEAGVRRAWPAIRDSNVSTLITCFVLYFFGAPLIKGFAITLAIGVAVSMFSAIVTTQQLLQIVAGLRPARRLAFYGVQAPKAA